jgi:hypothetical protein
MEDENLDWSRPKSLNSGDNKIAQLEPGLTRPINILFESDVTAIE